MTAGRAYPIQADDPRLTLPQKTALQAKQDALMGGNIDITWRDIPESAGHGLMTMHWYNGPTRLYQMVFPDGYLGPVGGHSPAQRRRR